MSYILFPWSLFLLQLFSPPWFHHGILDKLLQLLTDSLQLKSEPFKLTIEHWSNLFLKACLLLCAQYWPDPPDWQAEWLSLLMKILPQMMSFCCQNFLKLTDFHFGFLFPFLADVMSDRTLLHVEASDTGPQKLPVKTKYFCSIVSNYTNCNSSTDIG